MRTIITCFLSVAASLIMLASLVSCEKVNTSSDDLTQSNSDMPVEGNPEAKSAFSPIAMSESQKKMGVSINSFALDMLAGTIKENPDEDLVFSPISLSVDLSMCAAGAKGETADQMKGLLGFSDISNEDVNEYFRVLTEGLVKVDSLSSFTSANSLWVSESIPLKDAYVNTVSEAYRAKVSNVDFSSPSAAISINEWCKENTAGKIAGMLPEAPANISVALLNANLFNGIWGHKFDENLTTGPFHGRKGDVQSEFMTASDNEYGYYRLNSCRLLSLPYGKGGFSFLIAYPYEGTSADAVIKELNNPDNLQIMTMVSGLTRKINVSVPKFKIESTVDNIRNSLESLGMKNPFSKDADFSGMTDIPMKIDEILQKCCLEVNEKGTEAAAVTQIIMVTSLPDQSTTEDEFIVDSPFLFFILEEGSGTILYAGQKI